ncbi:MAG TPA: copper chaperone PCu(A)C [Caulobacteraceae bacterium]|jgi:hypothetical protein|nr:copper chaperone PCu(A)C [Caulobacteraceae bacterium]
MRTLVGAILIGLVALTAPAAAPVSPVAIQGGWMRPAAAGMNGAGYLTLVNHGRRPDRLISAASPVAARVTLHRSREVGGVMIMDSVPFLAIPAGGRSVLAPGGYHLMFEHLARPLRLGDRPMVALTFARAGTLRVRLTVANAGPATDAMRM